MAAGRLVTAQRRWIVSGTPARDRLFGVEVDLAALADVDELPSDFDMLDDTASLTTADGSLASDASITRRAALEKRKAYSREEEKAGAAKSLGIMASNFLQVRPWAELDNTESKADWEEHIYRHESFRGKSHSAFSSCLRRTLEILVIKVRLSCDLLRHQSNILRRGPKMSRGILCFLHWNTTWCILNRRSMTSSQRICSSCS